MNDHETLSNINSNSIGPTRQTAAGDQTVRVYFLGMIHVYFRYHTTNFFVYVIPLKLYCLELIKAKAKTVIYCHTSFSCFYYFAGFLLLWFSMAMI